MIKFSQTRPNRGLNLLRAKKFGFSLIEILVSLIIISLLVSAFVPVVTKKMKSSDITVGSFGTAVSSECDQFSTEGGKCLMCASGHCSLCSSQIVNVKSDEYVDPSVSCDPVKCTVFGPNCTTCTKDGCTSCSTVVGEGQYIDPAVSCVAQSCSAKFGMGCSACTKDHCTSCKGGYGYSASAHTCTQCNAGLFSSGGNSVCTQCGAGQVSSKGASGCTTCSVANHQVPNADSSACVNKTCGRGQYVVGVTCTSCPDGQYQESYNYTGTSCKTCNASLHQISNADKSGCETKTCGANQYIDGVTCKSCPSGCSSCESDTKCTACSSPYFLNSSNMCVKECVPQTVTLSGTNIKVTRFNMGDDPDCPRSVLEEKVKTIKTVEFIPVGTKCKNNTACCWYGATSSICTDKSGGIYSGCDRTVCNWGAADALCKSLGTGWALPKKTTLEAPWYPTNSTPTTGLMLCSGIKDNVSNANASACAANTSGCPHATAGAGTTCIPNHLHTNVTSTKTDTYGAYENRYALTVTGVWQIGESPKRYGYSVRCVYGQ